MHKQSNLFVLGGLIGSTLVTGMALMTPGVWADQESVSTATIRVKSTCSMTATVDTAHTATLVNGIYSGDYMDTANNNKPYDNGIGQTTISAFCNDLNGYAIYAIGYTGGDEGITNGTNTMLHSIDIGNSNYDIVTGTATSGDTSNWSMKLAAVDGTYEPTILNGYDNYHAVPSDYAKVAQYTSGTDATGSSLTATYAAYISATQPAGTYVGQVKYILVHPSSNLGPGTYYMQEVDAWGNELAMGYEITAYDNRDNKSYTVRRMCMESNISDANASWEEKQADCNGNGLLWMTQNLDLDLNSSVALNSINTDLNTSGSGAYVDGYIKDSDNVIYWTPANSTSRWDSDSKSFVGWTADEDVAYSADPDTGGVWYAKANVLPTSDSCRENGCNYLEGSLNASQYFQSSNDGVPDEPGYDGSHSKIGNYYNWSAAMASNNSVSLMTDTGDKDFNSVCPRGWRLPFQSEIASLNTVYNKGRNGKGQDWGAGLILDPVYMILSGSVGGGAKLGGAGYEGSFWTSTVADVTNRKVYYLYLRTQNLNIQGEYTNDRVLGASVRCVQRIP